MRVNLYLQLNVDTNRDSRMMVLLKNTLRSLRKITKDIERAKSVAEAKMISSGEDSEQEVHNFRSVYYFITQLLMQLLLRSLLRSKNYSKRKRS
jgi:hypothetical protein